MAFGIAWGDHTQTRIKDHNFLVTALEIMENIYEEHSEYDELVSNYTWGADFGLPPPLNISAVDRGKEVGKPYTFSYGALVLFIRWLGQTTPPFQRIAFKCYFTWLPGPGQVPQEFEVAEGVYTPWQNTGLVYSGPSNDTNSISSPNDLDGAVPITEAS